MTTFEYTSRPPLTGSRPVEVDRDRAPHGWWTILSFPTIIVFGIGVWLAADQALVVWLTWLSAELRTLGPVQQLVGLIAVLLLCRSVAVRTSRDDEAHHALFDVR